MLISSSDPRAESLRDAALEFRKVAAQTSDPGRKQELRALADALEALAELRENAVANQSSL
jgi:hypothetical protein